MKLAKNIERGKRILIENGWIKNRSMNLKIDEFQSAE